MPKYYFDVIDAGNFTRDDHGVDLADDDARDEKGVDLADDDEAWDEKGDIVYEANLTLHGRWRPGQRE